MRCDTHPLSDRCSAEAGSPRGRKEGAPPSCHEGVGLDSLPAWPITATGACRLSTGGELASTRAELRQPRTPLVASVGYFPEKYGEGLIRLALDILGRRAVPPAVFVRHHIITPENVDHFYPNDALLGLETPARF